MRAVYDNGMMINGDLLKVDVAATKRSVEVSNQEAFALALEVGYASKDTIKPLLQRAHQKAVVTISRCSFPNQRNHWRLDP